MKLIFEYLPANRRDLSSDGQMVFDDLVGGFRKIESKLVSELEHSTDLKFRGDIHTKVHERPEEMETVNGFKIPAYDGEDNTIQTFLMPQPYRFNAIQMHELTHGILEQNWKDVGGYVENFRESKQLPDLVGNHMLVYACMRNVAPFVFGKVYKEVLKQNRWWEYPELKGSELVEKLGPGYNRSWLLSEPYKEIMQNFRNNTKRC